MEQITKDWLQKNKNSLIKKNCVVITGAGISVSAGIPDFRSKEGIFAHIKQKYNTKGTELFKYSFGLNPKTRNIYLNFISDFKILSNSLNPSYSHKALNHFLSYQKKYTVYSQNICGLEKKAGIVNLVNLHGDTEKLKCMQCGTLHEFSDECVKAFKQGKEVECLICKNSTRKRVSFRGYLHPNIVHYEEEHPNCAELIDKITKDKDLSLLIVLGTSLKPYGVKQVIKYFLSQLKHKSQKKNKPFISLYINKEAPNKALSSFFTHNWFGTIEDFFMNFFDVLGDKKDFMNLGKKEDSKNKENKENKKEEENKENKKEEENKEVKKNLKIKIRKVNENKLIISNENKFQRKIGDDSLIIDSFVEEISSVINESPEKIENKIKVSKLIEKYENKRNITNDSKNNTSYDEIIDNNTTYDEINKKSGNKIIDKSDGNTNKYRTIILREDGKLEVKLPKKLSLTPTNKNITKANPKNYSPLLKKTKKEDC